MSVAGKFHAKALDTNAKLNPAEICPSSALEFLIDFPWRWPMCR